MHLLNPKLNKYEKPMCFEALIKAYVSGKMTELMILMIIVSADPII